MARYFKPKSSFGPIILQYLSKIKIFLSYFTHHQRTSTIHPRPLSTYFFTRFLPPSIRRPVPKNEGGGAVSRPILRPRRRGILVPRRHRRVDDDDDENDDDENDDNENDDKEGRRKKEEPLVPTTTGTISFFPPLFATLESDIIVFLAALRLPQRSRSPHSSSHHLSRLLRHPGRVPHRHVRGDQDGVSQAREGIPSRCLQQHKEQKQQQRQRRRWWWRWW